MRRLLIILIALCVAGTAYSEDIMIFKKKAAGGSTPPTYLAQESFDTNPGYDNVVWTWGNGGGTPDPDYATSPAPLEGTQSLFLDSCASSADVQILGSNATAPTDNTIQELYFIANFPVLYTYGGAAVSVVADLSSGGTAQATMSLVCTAGSCTPRIITNGATNGNAVGTIDNTNTWHFWVSYHPTADNTTWASVGFSSDGVRPTSGNNYAETSKNGTRTAVARQVRLWSDYTGTGGRCTTAIYDKVRVLDGAIPSNP